MKKFNYFITIALLSSLAFLNGCKEKPSEKEFEDVIIEQKETDIIFSDEKDISEGYELNLSEDSELLGEDDPEILQEILEGENSGISMSGDTTKRVSIEDLSKLHPSDISLKQKLDSNLIGYFATYCPDLDQNYRAYVITGTEQENDTYYSVKLGVRGFNSDGSDFYVDAIWVYGTPTGQFNFYSDLSPDGTDTLVDKDGNPIEWDSPIVNPFAEE